MNKTLFASSLSVVAIAGAIALVPMAVNAEASSVQSRGNGYRLHDGTGSGQQANGRQGSLESRAKALNITDEQLEEKLQTKTMLEIAKDQGMSTEQFQAKMREASAARWQERGLSAEEIKNRTAAQAERQANCDGTGDHEGRGVFGRGQRTE